MSIIKFLELDSKVDNRGYLGILESTRHIPFDIKRIYFLKNLQSDIPRGFHTHKKLIQAAVCISGNYEMILDDGKNKESVALNSSHSPLLIEPLIWHEMQNFSHDCIILVLASDFYFEDDYVRDYAQFLRMVNEEI